jgi:hypothetical protein
MDRKDGRKAPGTYFRNSSWVAPLLAASLADAESATDLASPAEVLATSPAVLAAPAAGLVAPEKRAANLRSKAMRSCAYLRRSCSYYAQIRTLEAGNKLLLDLTVLRSDISAHPRRTIVSFHAEKQNQIAKREKGKKARTEIVAIIHTRIHALTYENFVRKANDPDCLYWLVPAFGEWVWQASPAIKMRSFTENLVATCWRTSVKEMRALILKTNGAFNLLL